ncbi:MAG TPA: adenylyl-sulfate kinase, partial [Longimicrobiales bacterium]
LSALEGDNVVTHSPNTPWYEGGTLLHHLETVNVGADRNMIDFRFPVQYVVRPHQDYRGFAGRIASGTIVPGEEVVVLPNGRQTKIKSIDAFEETLPEAAAGDSVILTIEDEIDISRGDMIVRRLNVPTIANRFEAMLCWLNEQPLDPTTPYVMLHTSRQVQAFISKVVYRIDVDTLHRDNVATLGLNDIGRVEITSAKPIFFDPYQVNHATGSFVIIDPFTNVTVGAGMIRGEVKTADELFGDPEKTSPDVVWQDWNIPRTERELKNGHRSAVLWLTGLSGSGKSTIGRQLERALFEAGCQTMLLDGDQLRHGISGDLGFDEADRRENIRRAAEVARLFYEQGSIVICTFVSPFAQDRERARKVIGGDSFFEIFVDCDLDECRRRDPKGLYAKAERGEIPNFTGVTSAYEAPARPEITLKTSEQSVAQSVEQIMAELRKRAVLP